MFFHYVYLKMFYNVYAYLMNKIDINQKRLRSVRLRFFENIFAGAKQIDPNIKLDDVKQFFDAYVEQNQ